MEENNIKKIIIIGDKEKVSSKMLENIKEHYDCEIEIITQEEYANLGINDITDNSLSIERLYDMCPPEIPPIEILDPNWIDKKLHAPHNPRTIGKVNNKKLSDIQKQYQQRKRGR